LVLLAVHLRNKLNNAVGNAKRPPLKIFMQVRVVWCGIDRLRLPLPSAGQAHPEFHPCLQVNTSGEEAKSGVEPQGCTALAQHIAQNCPNLRLAGLMTIGKLDYTSTPENFKCLAECR
jgi:uncharacterized pyridoxal phosphate-containing UPF0001 family protein